jgi:dihydroorotate dehydrogenase (fumarate)
MTTMRAVRRHPRLGVPEGGKPMTDLTTTYLGLSLSNPLLVSASPLSQDVARIREMEYSGAAAVVLPSLFEEQLTGKHEGQSPVSTAAGEGAAPDLAAYNFGQHGYLEHIRQAKAAVAIPIIASLNATSPGSWVRYAREIEAAGADALELNIYDVPTSPEVTGATLEQSYCDLVSLAKANVRIPVAVKLSPYFTSLPNLAWRLDQAGANGLVLFNRFYQPDINIYERAITPTLDLSTPAELRLRLHWVATLFGQIRADLAVTGGVHEVYDVVKALLVGARVVMMTSALMQHGIAHLERVRKEVSRWLGDNGWKSVRDIQGQLSRRAVADPGVYERVNYMQIVTSCKPDARMLKAGQGAG